MLTRILLPFLGTDWHYRNSGPVEMRRANSKIFFWFNLTSIYIARGPVIPRKCSIMSLRYNSQPSWLPFQMNSPLFPLRRSLLILGMQWLYRVPSLCTRRNATFSQWHPSQLKKISYPKQGRPHLSALWKGVSFFL